MNSNNRFLNIVMTSAIQGRVVPEFYMYSPRHFRSISAAKAQEQRVLRSGRMYKVYIEGGERFVRINSKPEWDPSYLLFAAPDDNAAAKRAIELADFSSYCMGDTDRPKYTLSFRLFNINPDGGTDRFVWEFRNPHPKPDWKRYELVIPGHLYNPYDSCFYASDEQDAKDAAMYDAHWIQLTEEGRKIFPRDYVPRPYRLLQGASIVVDYIPSEDVEVDPKYLQW